MKTKIPSRKEKRKSMRPPARSGKEAVQGWGKPAMKPGMSRYKK